MITPVLVHRPLITAEGDEGMPQSGSGLDADRGDGRVVPSPWRRNDGLFIDNLEDKS